MTYINSESIHLNKLAYLLQTENPIARSNFAYNNFNTIIKRLITNTFISTLSY
ncbi:hypothetical protein GFV14_00583 [Candidatus Hartigia pinicola]|nr:hypothetical protein GFV14_00583 [Candidatus Hartigia pinicola]